jgi:sRNA-binding protein
VQPFLEPTTEFFDRSAVSPAPDLPTAPLTPDRKSEAQRAYREARTAIALLQQRWPAAFPEGPQQVRPLVAGLVPLIATALGWSRPYTRSVLCVWKLRPAYCHAVLAHPVRFDLEGNPTDQPIDEGTRAQATLRLATLANRHRRTAPNKPPGGGSGATQAPDHR